jgi:hypothetical protein
MIRKIIIFIFLINTIIFADDLEISYNYIGTWEVVNSFYIDNYFINCDMNVQRANEFIGKTIVYGEKEIIFLNKEYVIESTVSDYFTNEELRKETRGSGTPGFDFFDLRIDRLMVSKIRSLRFRCKREPLEPIFGEYIYVINNNLIIIEFRGFFFLARRI